MKNNDIIMHSELSLLLSETAKFLRNACEEQRFSPESLATTTTLIERLNKHAIKLSDYLNSRGEDDSAKYVDMQGGSLSDSAKHTHANNFYSKEVPTVHFNPDKRKNKSNKGLHEEMQFPFADFPAAQIPVGGKSGLITRKEKIIVFEINRSFFAAIHECWLLIYYNRKQLKPYECYNLKECQARMSNGQENSFEFTSTTKSFTIFTTGHKDALEWVAAINYRFKPLPLIGNQILNDTSAVNFDEVEIYEQLNESTHGLKEIPFNSPAFLFEKCEGTNTKTIIDPSKPDNIYDVVSPRMLDY